MFEDELFDMEGVTLCEKKCKNCLECGLGLIAVADQDTINKANLKELGQLRDRIIDLAKIVFNRTNEAKRCHNNVAELVSEMKKSLDELVNLKDYIHKSVELRLSGLEEVAYKETV